MSYVVEGEGQSRSENDPMLCIDNPDVGWRSLAHK